MRVRFLRSIASFDFGYHTGQVAEIDEAQASAWIVSGICVREDAVPAQSEAAVVSVPERAMRPRAKGRR